MGALRPEQTDLINAPLHVVELSSERGRPQHGALPMSSTPSKLLGKEAVDDASVLRRPLQEEVRGLRPGVDDD